MDIKPMIPFEPINSDHIPTGKEWIAQVKWDGTRILLYHDQNRTRLFNRRLNEKTLQYPEILDTSSYCHAHSVILDGEMIALEHGKPSFHRVMKRDRLKHSQKIQAAITEVPVIYMIFDLIYLNGEWVTAKPLKERQQILERIIVQNKRIQLVRNHDDAHALFNAVVEHDLEGIVIKDLNSKYAIHGKDKRWQKKKNDKDLYAVVGGVTLRSGIVNAILLGLYDEEGQLWYVGHAGTGKMKKEEWRELTEHVKPLVIEDAPFANQPNRAKEAIWLKPEITVKIKFSNWTEGHALRQPSIQAFVNMSVYECTFDQSF